jgi:DNA modification methylase
MSHQLSMLFNMVSVVYELVVRELNKYSQQGKQRNDVFIFLSVIHYKFINLFIRHHICWTFFQVFFLIDIVQCLHKFMINNIFKIKPGTRSVSDKYPFHILRYILKWKRKNKHVWVLAVPTAQNQFVLFQSRS